jgi:Domain of unknown function (DUF4129)
MSRMVSSTAKVVLLGVALWIHPGVNAQVPDTVVTAVDTSVTVTEAPATEKMRFDSITTVDAVQARDVSKQKVQQFRQDDDFWYANTKPDRRPPAVHEALIDKQWFRTLLWILIIAAFITIVYLFVTSGSFNLFRSKARKLAGHSGATIEAENLFDVDFDTEIARARANREFASAIRLHYLHCLVLLANAGVMEYNENTTNSEYVSRLYRTPYYQDFFRLTRRFEYAWYGKFPVPERAFATVEAEFTQFKNRIHP